MEVMLWGQSSLSPKMQGTLMMEDTRTTAGITTTENRLVQVKE